MIRRVLLPLIVLLACLVYALLRYNVFGTVSPQQIPLYIVNKALSFAGLILLGCSRCVGEPVRRRELGRVGLGLVLVHVVLSLCILNARYFAKLFAATGYMTWQGEASMLTGCLSLLALVMLFFTKHNSALEGTTSRSNGLLPGLGRAMLLLAVAHVGLIGYVGWFRPGEWPGSMPPITLLSCVAALVAVLWRRRAL